MRSRTFAAVRVGVSVAIVAGLIYKLSPSELADTIRGSNLLLLLAALALMLLSQLLVIVKWALLLRARDVRAPAPLIVRTYCIGNLLSNLLPGAISGDVYRVYRVHRDARLPSVRRSSWSHYPISDDWRLVLRQSCRARTRLVCSHTRPHISAPGAVRIPR